MLKVRNSSEKRKMVQTNTWFMFEQNPSILGLGPQNARILRTLGLLDISAGLGRAVNSKKIFVMNKNSFSLGLH